MDIEGAEWDTLLQMPEELFLRFRIMVIEFHFMDNLFNEPFFRICHKVFKKILNSHEVVHIHPNNVHKSEAVLGIEIPRFMEFTFLRKDRIKVHKPAIKFPHPLDRDCTKNKSYYLPKIWYSN